LAKITIKDKRQKSKDKSYAVVQLCRSEGRPDRKRQAVVEAPQFAGKSHGDPPQASAVVQLAEHNF
jgi:hypothetical protein